MARNTEFRCAEHSIVILREMQAKRLRRHGDMLFPGLRGRISRQALNKLMARMKADAAPHNTSQV